MKKWMRVFLSTAMVLAMVTLAVVVYPAGSAHAATCYKDGCDGQDPIASGCTAGTVTTDAWSYIYEIGPNGSTEIGKIEARLSHAAPYGCNTVWARVTSFVGSVSISADIYSHRVGTDSYYSQTTTSAWTNEFGRDGTFYIEGCVTGVCSDLSYS